VESFDASRLGAIGRTRRSSFCDSVPFPHIIIDDFLKEEAAESIRAESEIHDDSAIRYQHLSNRSLGEAARLYRLCGDEHAAARVDAAVDGASGRSE
jgi:hypothetical protein